MDKLACINAFVVVARHQSFTLASVELNTTQSAISKKIAWLEKDLGFSLFERSVRKIKITDLGTKYLTSCQRVLEQMAATELSLRNELTAIKGEIRISSPSAFTRYFLVPIIDKFMRNYPDVSFDVSVNDKQVDLYKDDIDVAIRGAYLADSDLKARKLMTHEVSYFASPQYIESFGIPTIEKLDSHQCITYSLMKPTDSWKFGEREVKLNEVLSSDSPEFIVQMCRAGHGIGAMPKWMVERDFRENSLVEVFLEQEKYSIPMFALFKRNSYMPMRLRIFIDFLSDELACS